VRGFANERGVLRAPYTADYIHQAEILSPVRANMFTLGPDDIEIRLSSRSALPGRVCHHLGHVCAAPKADADAPASARMESKLRKRDETNPPRTAAQGRPFIRQIRQDFPARGQGDEPHASEAWEGYWLTGRVCAAGATWAVAQMSPKHPNFLINTGGRGRAGRRLEAFRRVGCEKKVYDSSGGVTLGVGKIIADRRKIISWMFA